MTLHLVVDHIHCVLVTEEAHISQVQVLDHIVDIGV